MYLRCVIVDIDTFLKLRKELPMVDVRSEGEFEEGHIPGAVNIPILNNSERIIVGTTYKQEGQQEAIRAGFRLVGPRLSEIIAEAENVGKELLVHCWRGGMRSGNFCQFVGMAGVKTHQLQGGYKAYRQKATESFAYPYQFHILAGHTGSGKSEILRAIQEKGEQVIDLEDLANHKGSVFGGLGMPAQPTTEQFQNDLYEKILTLNPSRPIWIEDESVAVGKIFLPQDFWRTMGKGRVVIAEVDKSIRIQRLVKEYDIVSHDLFLEAMNGIVKKLGGQHYQAAKEKVMEGDMAAAIDILLTYYDKAYTNGIERKKDRIIQRHTWDGTEVDKFADFLISESKVNQGFIPS